MFRFPTVFLLGAGASWHYGYPTGADLVKKVLTKAGIVHSFCVQATKSPDASAIVHCPNYLSPDGSNDMPFDGTKGISKRWEKGRSEAEELISRLISVDPLVIDYFLGSNAPLQRIGKLLITWVLLECEAEYSKIGGNINRRDALENSPEEFDRLKAPKITLSRYEDNWYRFLVHKLTTNCWDSHSLISNNVHFLTFNYDVSLEARLYKALSAISKFEQNDVKNFLKARDRFIHIYGRIRSDPFADPPAIKFPVNLTPRPRPNPVSHEETQLFQEYKRALDIIYGFSTDIQTIAPNEKTITDDVRAARELITKAACVYILGYGFDENNSLLLELPKRLRLGGSSETSKVVMFTNFRNITQVNKNASRVFFGPNNELLSRDPVIIRDTIRGYHLERSDGDVYRALNSYFDFSRGTPYGTDEYRKRFLTVTKI